MITRRHILTTALLLTTVLAVPVHAEDKPTEIRIGTQKGGFFPAVRQRQTLENAFKPLGVEIKWIDFQFGPPLRRFRLRRRFAANLRTGRQRKNPLCGGGEVRRNDAGDHRAEGLADQDAG